MLQLSPRLWHGEPLAIASVYIPNTQGEVRGYNPLIRSMLTLCYFLLVKVPRSNKARRSTTNFSTCDAFCKHEQNRKASALADVYIERWWVCS